MEPILDVYIEEIFFSRLDEKFDKLTDYYEDIKYIDCMDDIEDIRFTISYKIKNYSKLVTIQRAFEQLDNIFYQLEYLHLKHIFKYTYLLALRNFTEFIDLDLETITEDVYNNEEILESLYETEDYQKLLKQKDEIINRIRKLMNLEIDSEITERFINDYMKLFGMLQVLRNKYVFILAYTLSTRVCDKAFD